MENAGEALKLAAFTLIFVMCLSLAMTNIMKAKRTSEEIIKYSDKSALFSYIESSDTEVDSDGNRIVEFNQIIPTLYKYKDEEYIIEFFDENRDPLTIFELTEKNSQVNLVVNKKDNPFKGCNEINFLNYNLENEKIKGNWINDIKGHVDEIIKYLSYKKNISFSTKFIEKVKEENNIYYNSRRYVEPPDDDNYYSKEYNNKKYRVIQYYLQNS